MGRRLQRSELGAAVEPMVKAFWNYPETVHLLPQEGPRGRALPRYLRSDAKDAARFDLLLGAEVDGVIRGAAAWIPPEAYPVSIGRQVFQALDLLPALPSSWRSLPEARRGQAAEQTAPSRFRRSLLLAGHRDRPRGAVSWPWFVSGPARARARRSPRRRVLSANRDRRQRALVRAVRVQGRRPIPADNNMARGVGDVAGPGDLVATTWCSGAPVHGFGWRSRRLLRWRRTRLAWTSPQMARPVATGA